MSFEDWLEVPLAKSPLSMSATRKPRNAASRATPAPMIPPPMISTSNRSEARAAKLRFMEWTDSHDSRRIGGRRGEKLDISSPAATIAPDGHDAILARKLLTRIIEYHDCLTFQSVAAQENTARHGRCSADAIGDVRGRYPALALDGRHHLPAVARNHHRDELGAVPVGLLRRRP